MSNEKIYTPVEPTHETLRNYDLVCGSAFVNLYTLTKNSDTITFRNFDPKNEEHLFVLGVARGLAGVFHQKVYLNISRFQLWKLNRGLDKECKACRTNTQENTDAIDPGMLLDFMREEAVQLCGASFTFASIYRQYYARKKGY